MMAAIGADPDRLEIPILQFVHLVEGSARASMSKRRGDFVTLDELIARDRRRRRALLHAQPLARVDGRPRPRPRARAVQREPRLLRAVRPRADRLGAAQGGGGARRRRAGRRDAAARRRCTRPSARWSRSCWRSRTRSPRPPSAARRTASRPTRSSSRRSFTAFYRDCQVVGAEPAALETWRLRLSVAAQRTIALAPRPAGRHRARRDVSERRAAAREALSGAPRTFGCAAL